LDQEGDQLDLRLGAGLAEDVGVELEEARGRPFCMRS
jgi:hypothetical protein